MWKIIVAALVALIVGAVGGVFVFNKAFPLTDMMARQEAFAPENRDYFFQNTAEVFPTRTVASSGRSEPLLQIDGVLKGFSFPHEGTEKTLPDMFTDMETAGMVILYKGEIIHEQYARGSDATTQFTSFSMVKSITSTLVGFAVFDGLIESVEDPLETYLPEIVGTAYEGVTIRQTLEMSSGVRFDAKGWPDAEDTVAFITDSMVLGKVRAYDRAISFPRAEEPGTKFNYNTAESQVLLELVRRVTGKDAADYLSEKAWKPLGMAHNAGWNLDRAGQEGAEIGGAFFNGTVRDWARFGLLMAQDGTWKGERLLPEGWVKSATQSNLPHLAQGVVHPAAFRGYAWHWWTMPNGAFTASGANGQSIYVNPAKDLVVARASAWPKGWLAEYDAQTESFYNGLVAWLDGRTVTSIVPIPVEESALEPIGSQ